MPSEQPDVVQTAFFYQRYFQSEEQFAPADATDTAASALYVEIVGSIQKQRACGFFGETAVVGNGCRRLQGIVLAAASDFAVEAGGIFGDTFGIKIAEVQQTVAGYAVG